MRIAGLRSPPIETRATPDTCEIAGMRKLSAFSWTTVSGSVSERNERVRMGGSAGLTLRKVGGVDIACGNDFPAAVIAACTSCAARSILRLRSNWITTSVAIQFDLNRNIDL